MGRTDALARLKIAIDLNSWELRLKVGQGVNRGRRAYRGVFEPQHWPEMTARWLEKAGRTNALGSVCYQHLQVALRETAAVSAGPGLNTRGPFLVCERFYRIIRSVQSEINDMCRTEAIAKRRFLNLEIDTLNSLENQSREKIETQALRAYEIQCERVCQSRTIEYDYRSVKHQ
jgi:hypothetical protein